MRILVLKKSMSGSDYHRIEIPFRYIMTGGNMNGWMVKHLNSNQSVMESDFQDIDILLFSRECPYDLDLILRFQKKYNFKIVIDIDDYWRLPVKHYLSGVHEAFKNGDAICKAMHRADMVWVTNKELADKAIHFCRDTHIIPNALPYGSGQFQFKEPKFPDDKKNILYTGGPSHYYDLAEIRGYFAKCKNDPEIQNSMRFLMAGYNDTNKESIDQWNKIENICKGFGAYSRLMSKGLESYMDHYDMAHMCIGPLEDNEFNRCKSNLKTLEAGCKHLPIIVSDVYPFKIDKDMHGEGLFLCKSVKDWWYYTKKLLRDPDLMKKMGKKLAIYCAFSYNLTEVNKKRKELLKSLL